MLPNVGCFACLFAERLDEVRKKHCCSNSFLLLPKCLSETSPPITGRKEHELGNITQSSTFEMLNYYWTHWHSGSDRFLNVAAWLVCESMEADRKIKKQQWRVSGNVCPNRKALFDMIWERAWILDQDKPLWWDDGRNRVRAKWREVNL